MASSDPHPVRLSSRISRLAHEKLVALAKAKRWVNTKGKPNISMSLNYILERFKLPPQKRKKKDG